MKNNRFANPTAGALLIALVTLTGRLNAQSNNEFVPFDRFVEDTRTVRSNQMFRADSRVREASTLEEMRGHVLRMYEGVHVTHSFVQDSAHFDCIPVEQQPTARLFGLDSIAQEPPQSILMGYAAGNDDAAEGPTNQASQANPVSAADEFGNSTTCEEHTIPMRRITMTEMAGFSSLREFFQKGSTEPRRGVDGEFIAPSSPSDGHKYSIMYQNVNNLGGGSSLNLWDPSVQTSRGEVMSLSQQWYTAGTGASTQTAEVGWQVMPGYWGTTKAVLFIYWTARDYDQVKYPGSQGGGCYNMKCAGFVQTSAAYTLGAAFTTYSTPGGAQRDFSAEYHLYNGNWWLAINGTFIGYFPGSIYQGGQLSKNAQSIQFGTESVGSPIWPQEGSGYWATSGFGYAAYQRNVFYHDMSGNAIQPTLKPYTPSPACYSISGPFKSNSTGWNVYFYEGGPGGPGC